MYYAAQVDGQWVRCNMSDKVPDVTLFAGKNPTEEDLKPFGVIIVHDSLSIPEYDPETQCLIELQPAQDIGGRWYARYEVAVKPQEPTPPTVPEV